MTSPNDPVSGTPGSNERPDQFTAQSAAGNQASVEAAGGHAAKKKKAFPGILLVVIAAILLLCGGTVAFLLISGRIGPQHLSVRTKSSGTTEKNIVTIGHFTLNGIIYSQSTPVAIINGRSCRVGETVDGARIDSIQADTVVMTVNDKEYSLRLQ